MQKAWIFLGMLCLAGAASGDSAHVKAPTAAPVVNDQATAVKALAAAYAGGDQSAGVKLINLLYNGPDSVRDQKQACRIAYMLSEMQNPRAYTARALCINAGMEAGEDRIGKSKAWARKAMSAGDMASAHFLYMLFLNDPKYQYATDGKSDEAKYKSLAAMPVAGRGDQIEAIDALAYAVANGYQPALPAAIAYLADHSAPDNINRLVNLATTMGLQLPQATLKSHVVAAHEVKGYGSTHASTKLFFETFRAATTAAVTRYRQIYGEECRDAKLRRAAAGAIRNTEYLPLKAELLRNSYLLKGDWEESWLFSVCGKEIPLVVAFSADGWGGAAHKISLPPDRQ